MWFFYFIYSFIFFVLSYPMQKLLCESIVYCDYFLLIILLIVGVMIDNKAFVCCLFVCLFVWKQHEHKEKQTTTKQVVRLLKVIHILFTSFVRMLQNLPIRTVYILDTVFWLAIYRVQVLSSAYTKVVWLRPRSPKEWAYL